MNEFDEKAATWDDDPVRVERAESIAKEMRNILDLESFKSAMEYGSGTGLLSFALKDDLENVVMMDSSEEMTRVAIEKCRREHAVNLHPLKCDLTIDEFAPEEPFDLIYNLLSFHHVEDTDQILSRFREIMKPGGTLVIIDLEKEDGSFHDGEFHGHLGFDRIELESKLKKSRFKPSNYQICYRIEKGEGVDKRYYPVFMLVANLEL